MDVAGENGMSLTHAEYPLSVYDDLGEAISTASIGEAEGVIRLTFAAASGGGTGRRIVVPAREIASATIRRSRAVPHLAHDRNFARRPIGRRGRDIARSSHP
jgi:hypothetical protein